MGFNSNLKTGTKTGGRSTSEGLMQTLSNEKKEMCKRRDMIDKIISGGQTGADRAALDVAIELGIPHGGWVPKGRKTEAGRLPAKYQLKEMPTDSYPERTEQNVLDSDGTLIISHGSLTGARITPGKWLGLMGSPGCILMPAEHQLTLPFSWSAHGSTEAR